MEQKTKRILVMAVLAVLTLLAFFLRQNVAAAQGRLLIWLSLAALAAFAAYTLSLRPGKAWPFDSETMALPLIAMAAAGLMLGGALLRYSAGGKLLMVALPALTALCWAVIGLQLRSGQPSPWLYMLPVLFFGAELVDKFRTWGSDPQILDYCYTLLALIATMCAVFHMAGFCFGKGSRRLTAFFAMSGIFFNGTALADAAEEGLCFGLAAVLWLGVSLWQLLQPRRKKTSDEDSRPTQTQQEQKEEEQA